MCVSLIVKYRYICFPPNWVNWATGRLHDRCASHRRKIASWLQLASLYGLTHGLTGGRVPEQHQPWYCGPAAQHSRLAVILDDAFKELWRITYVHSWDGNLFRVANFSWSPSKTLKEGLGTGINQLKGGKDVGESPPPPQAPLVLEPLRAESCWLGGGGFVLALLKWTQPQHADSAGAVADSSHMEQWCSTGC